MKSNAPDGASGRTARLFIALWPEDGVREALLSNRDAWVWGRSAAPVPADQLHLTLHFLGATPRTRLPELTRDLGVPCPRFDLSFGRFALWPGGIAVLEAGFEPPGLVQLHASLGERLGQLGFPPELRSFRPHVTLARRAGGSVAPERVLPAAWRVEGYALAESRPGPGGGYSVLERYS